MWGSAEDRGDRSGRRWLWPALYPGAREGWSPLVSSIRETRRPSGSEATWRHDEQGAATGASASRRRPAGRGTTAMPRPVKKAPAGGSASRHSGTRRDPGPSASGEVYVTSARDRSHRPETPRGWLQVRVLSEPTTKSIAGQSPVCGRGGLSPQLSGKCLHRQSGLRASPPTPKNSTIKNRGQLLSFLCAVAPNRTMSLQPPFHFGLA